MRRAPNLLPTALMDQRRARRRLNVWLRCIAPLTACVLLGVVWSWGARASARSEAGDAMRYAEASAKAARTDLDLVRRRYNAAVTRRAEAARLDRQPDISLLLVLIDDVCGEHVHLHRWRAEVADGGFDLMFDGASENLAEAAAFAKRLSAFDVFDRVQLGETTRQSDGVARFTLSARLHANGTVAVAVEETP